MAQWWFFTGPLIAAVVGWSLCSLFIYLVFRPAADSLLPRFSLSHRLSENGSVPEVIHAAVKGAFLQTGVLSAITDSANFEKLRPYIETHIDTFLRVKLKEQMPMIGSMIGERTISQLKEVFMNELELLFPDVMTQYVSTFQDIDLTPIIDTLATKMTEPNFQKLVRQKLRRELNRLKMLCAIVGFSGGVIQLLAFFAFYR